MENWNPLTDTVPIHSWIHPWLPLMQVRLEPLYAPIRNKLANALQKWHPSDSSAKLILQPWKEVFTPGSWEAFMVKNIVPKLGEQQAPLWDQDRGGALEQQPLTAAPLSPTPLQACA